MMGNTKGFGDNNFFVSCLTSHHSSLLNSLPWDLEWISCRWGSVVPTYILLLLACHSGVCLAPECGDRCLFSWGLLLCLFSFDKGECWDLTIIVRIGHDTLSTNKFIEASTVFGHGVSSLVCGAVAVAAALGCCSSRGLLPMGKEMPPSSWDLLVG